MALVKVLHFLLYRSEANKFDSKIIIFQAKRTGNFCKYSESLHYTLLNSGKCLTFQMGILFVSTCTRDFTENKDKDFVSDVYKNLDHEMNGMEHYPPEETCLNPVFLLCLPLFC